MLLSKHKKGLYGSLFLTLLVFFLLPKVSLALTTGLEYATALEIGTRDLRSIIFQVINIFIGFLGVVALVIVLYGGYIYMTSAGDEKEIERAKKILINGSIGLLIILSSWGIVNFIFSLFGIGGGGGNGAGQPAIGNGPRALGNGIIVSHYPGRNQRDVARNTIIAVTFREAMSPATICATTPCNTAGININDANIKIYKNSDGETSSMVSADVSVISLDNKTFTFKTKDYLGDSANTVWYTVTLKKDLKKADNSPAFPELMTGDTGYDWQFEVSDKIDLTPPKISSVIPFPDNNADTYSSTTASQAAGSIIVIGSPQVYKPVNISNVTTVVGTVSATVGGSYTGNTDQTGASAVQVTITSSTVANVFWGATHPNTNTTVPISNNIVPLGSGLNLNISDPSYTNGNQWSFEITAEKPADYLRVGNTNYQFVASNPTGNQIVVGATSNATAQNIKDKIDSQPTITATVSANIVTVTADIAGVTGNSIVLNSVSSALNITPMTGGVDSGDSQAVVDKKDQPRNAIVQINFDEAMNPMSAIGEVLINGGGDTGSALDALSFNNLVVSAMIGATKTYIGGTWVISNQYKTLEFIPKSTCGVNSCGEDVFCLANDSTVSATNITVEIKSAILKPCTVSAECTDGLFNQCLVNCQDGGGVNSPQADFAPAGLIDMSNNSLDGNKDGKSAGPVSYFNENTPVITTGDNYQWSFWINDKIDLIAPVIEEISPSMNGIINLEDPVEIKFSKLMMGSTLRPGDVDGKSYLTLIDRSVNPVGYWTSSENIDESSPLDGVPDKTRAYLNHTSFTISSNYQAQAGEGVKDLYQNCYVPAIGPGCSSATQSCCNGTATNSADCL